MRRPRASALPGARESALQRRRQLLGRERKAAAQVERRGRVVQAEGEDAHAAIIKLRAVLGRRQAIGVRGIARPRRSMRRRHGRSTSLASAQLLRCRRWRRRLLQRCAKLLWRRELAGVRLAAPRGLGVRSRRRWCSSPAWWSSAATARWRPTARWCGLRAGAVVGRLRAAAPQRRLTPSGGDRRQRCATTSPRSECGSASVIVTSTIWPTSRGVAREVDDAVALGAAHQLARVLARRRLRPGCAARVPTSAALMRAHVGRRSRACSRCRRASLTACGVSSCSAAAGVPGRGLKTKLKLPSKPTSSISFIVLREVGVGLAGEADDEVAATAQMPGRTARSLRIVLLYSSAV